MILRRNWVNFCAFRKIVSTFATHCNQNDDIHEVIERGGNGKISSHWMTRICRWGHWLQYPVDRDLFEGIKFRTKMTILLASIPRMCLIRSIQFASSEKFRSSILKMNGSSMWRWMKRWSDWQTINSKYSVRRCEFRAKRRRRIDREKLPCESKHCGHTSRRSQS